ncbi:hypothetical protein HPP92_011670 [Vanilla planifolia]|uniref:Saposin-like type B region 1 domain-containing protein n=1 Tax=Vanilla planifolia TaxID=51239 RepID=A0A835R6G6_VANPL|nr:hypothetical protein HPP92_011670 [Vanilla planifolia]
MGYKMALIFLGIMIIGCSKVEAKNVEFLDITSTDAANGQWCQVCQDFITKASFFLRENETRTQIIGALHDACFHLPSFKQSAFCWWTITHSFSLRRLINCSPNCSVKRSKYARTSHLLI